MITKSGYGTSKTNNVSSEKTQRYKKLLEEPQKQQVSYTPVNSNKFIKDNFLTSEEIDKRIYTLPDGTTANKQDYTPEEQQLLLSGKYKINPNYDPNKYMSQKILSTAELKSSEQFRKEAYDNANALGKAEIVAGKVGNTLKDIGTSAILGPIQAAEGWANTGLTVAANAANLIGAKDTADYLTNMIKLDAVGDAKKELDSSTQSGYGRYNPNVLGVDLRDIAREGTRMFTAGVGGLPGFITSAIGGNVQESLNEGQSLGRASIYGGLTGTAEGAFEKLFDTFNLLGGGVLDKFIPKNAVAKLAITPVGEYIEEWLTQGINPFIKMATYEGDIKNPFASWENVKEWLHNNNEAGWQGFVMGLILKGTTDISNSQARQEYKNEVKKAVNKIKGLTQQQKQVAIDTLVNEANTSNIQPESMGKVINNQNINYSPVNAKQVLAQPNIKVTKKGTRILPTAQETQQGKPLALRQGTDIYVTPEGQAMTTETYSDYETGKLKLPTIKTNSVYQAAKGKVDVKIANRLMDIAERTNARVEGFYNENPDIEGSYKDGVIRINVNSEKAADTIFAHEFTHHLESTNAWKDVRDAIINSNTLYNMLSEKGINIDEYKQQIKDAYAKIKTKENPNGIILDDAGVEKEIVAKFVESKLMKDEKTIVRMINENPSFMQRLKNFWDDLVVRFKGTAEEKELRRIQNIYNKAFAEAQKGTTTSTETEYSIGGIKGARRIQNNANYSDILSNYDKATQMIADNKNIDNETLIRETGWYKDTEGNLKYEFTDEDMDIKDNFKFDTTKMYSLEQILKHDIIFEAYPELKDYTVISGNLGNKDGAIFAPGKIILLNKNKLNTKSDVAATLMHEVQHAIQVVEGFPGARTTWGGKSAYFESLGEIEAADTKRRIEMTMEERARILPETAKPNPIHPAIRERNQAKQQAVRQSVNEALNGTVGKDTQYSINTDNQGRKLSQEQQEFFKDSKVRDEDGRLLEVYHGSNSEFTIFDISKSGRSNTNAGVGFWFTTDKEGATTFANQAWWGDKNQKTYETYLNIKNPKVFESFDNSNELGKISERLSEIKKMKEDIFWKDTYIFQNYRISQYTDEEYIDSLVEYNYSNKEKQNQMKKLMKEYVELSKEESLLDKKYENERYTDSYEQFRTEIYKLAGKDADFANSNNTGRYIENHEDLVKQYREKLIKEGYDGIIIKDTKYDNGIFETKRQTNTQYVVFDSNQIKNVDNTNPTENADIRYSIETDKQTSTPKREKVVDKIAPQTDIEIDNLPDETEKVARVLTKAPKKQQDFSFETVKDVLMRKIVDAGNTINTIGKIAKDDVLYPMYNNTKQARQSAEYMIGEKQTDITGTRIVGNSLIEVFEPIKRKGEEYTGKFYEYLLHMHNIDRMAQDKPVFGKSVTAEDSKRIADQLLKENPEFERLANRVYVYNRNLMQWRVDSGLVSQEQADEMNRIYPHYVPTFRDMSGIAGAKVIGNSVNISQTLKKATGSDRDILPIDLSMARQTMQTVQAAKRNLLGNRLLNDALANKDQVGKYITTIEKSDDSLDIDEQSDAALSSDKNNNIFKIYRDGKSVNMYVNNGIFEGLKAISSQTDNTDTSKLLSALSKPNTIFKQLVTGFNPMFMLKNPIRDVQDAALYSKNLREFAKEYPQTFKEMVNNSKDWQLYKSLGGTGSTFFDYETGIENELNKGKLTRAKEATLGRIEYLNMLTEQAPRFAEFKATLEKAGNRDYDTLLKAVYNAADVTVNFGRSGSITQILNKTAVPFLNPSIQGASKTIRTIVTTKGGTEWAKLVTKLALFGILPSVLNELLYWDDEDYEKLNDRDKDVNFVLKYGDNQWIKIPKGRVISFLGNLANRGIRVARGQEVNWGDFLATTLDQTAPISPFESNIVSPIKAVKDNKTWYGSDIVPQRLQQYEPRDQYDEKTDAFSKWLGGILNYSPKKINYLIDAYTGVIGDFALPLTTPTAEKNPFAKAFTIDGTFSNEIGNKFYETKDKYNKYKNDTPTATVVTRYLNKQNEMASDLYAEIRKVQSSDISDKEKKAKASELRELINLIQANAVLYAEEYEQVVNKYINKFPKNPDRSADYAYLMANYELFGPEYAVKTYNLSTYNKNKHKNMQTVFNQIKNNFNTTKPVSAQKTETLPTAKDIPTKK